MNKLKRNKAESPILLPHPKSSSESDGSSQTEQTTEYHESQEEIQRPKKSVLSPHPSDSTHQSHLDEEHLDEEVLAKMKPQLLHHDHTHHDPDKEIKGGGAMHSRNTTSSSMSFLSESPDVINAKKSYGGYHNSDELEGQYETQYMSHHQEQEKKEDAPSKPLLLKTFQDSS